MAVNDVSFEIEKGKVYGLLGPNGSGKSTILGMILNVVNPTSGSFDWFNGQVSNHKALKKIGAIIEYPKFYPYMNAVQNLDLVAKIKEAGADNVDTVLQLVNLYERRKDDFETYSLGMKQRLAIASALLNEPEILILDEPTNGLDPQGIHEIREIIKSIAEKGTTILLASHLLDEVEKVCQDVIVLNKGKMIFKGAVRGMTADEGFFELKSQDNEVLIQVLKTHPAIEKVEGKEDLVLAYLSAPLDSESLNKYVFDHEIVLSHLVKRKESLEEMFLALTK